MRIVLQRVTSASVRVGDPSTLRQSSGQATTIGAIGPGLLVLIGVREGDDEATAQRLATKTAELRIFSDPSTSSGQAPSTSSGQAGKFNLSLLDVGGEALVVSQFTLYADTRRGRRPSFLDAGSPEIAAPLVEAYATTLEALGVTVARGRFGAMMQVELVNDGPVTIVIDSEDAERPRRAK